VGVEFEKHAAFAPTSLVMKFHLLVATAVVAEGFLLPWLTRKRGEETFGILATRWPLNQKLSLTS